MKPLVYWCRWHNARLRLHGRDETAVWGELVLPGGPQPFRYKLQPRELTFGRGDDARQLFLDEMGVEKAAP